MDVLLKTTSAPFIPDIVTAHTHPTSVILLLSLAGPFLLPFWIPWTNGSSSNPSSKGRCPTRSCSSHSSMTLCGTHCSSQRCSGGNPYATASHWMSATLFSRGGQLGPHVRGSLTGLRSALRSLANPQANSRADTAKDQCHTARTRDAALSVARPA